MQRSICMGLNLANIANDPDRTLGNLPWRSSTNWLLTMCSRAGVSTRHSMMDANSWRDKTSDSVDFTRNSPLDSSIVTVSARKVFSKFFKLVWGCTTNLWASFPIDTTQRLARGGLPSLHTCPLECDPHVGGPKLWNFSADYPPHPAQVSLKVELLIVTKSENRNYLYCKIKTEKLTLNWR